MFFLFCWLCCFFLSWFELFNKNISRLFRSCGEQQVHAVHLDLCVCCLICKVWRTYPTLMFTTAHSKAFRNWVWVSIIYILVSIYLFCIKCYNSPSALTKMTLSARKRSITALLSVIMECLLKVEKLNWSWQLKWNQAKSFLCREGGWGRGGVCIFLGGIQCFVNT